jgi:hypothetical protein
MARAKRNWLKTDLSIYDATRVNTIGEYLLYLVLGGAIEASTQAREKLDDLRVRIAFHSYDQSVSE